MAGVNSESGVAVQLRLIAGLRWRMFVNSLRTRGGKADLAGRLIRGTSIGTGVVGIGFLMALGGWAAVQHSQPRIFAIELWAVFAIWQILPIFLTGFGAQADLGLLLRYPLSYPAFVLLTLSYGLLDPVALAAIYWMAMIFAGIGIASPAALPWAALGLGAFAGMNLLLNRAVFAWLDRWLAQRRTREILGIVFFVFVIGIQFIGPVMKHWGAQASSAVHSVSPIESVSPPGLAAAVMEGVQPGSGPRALASLAALALVGCALGWALAFRLRAQFRGENLGEAPRAEAQAAKRNRGKDAGLKPVVQQSWTLPGVSPAVQALLEKDLRYLLRNTGQYFALAIPLVIVIVFSFRTGGSQGARDIPLAGSAFFFPVALAYCSLVVLGPAYNALGYDGAGVAMLFAAPVRFRDVLAAKNLLYSLIFAFEAAAVLVVTLVAGSAFKPSIVCATLAALLFVLPVNFAAGNLASLYFPRVMQFGGIRRQRASGMTMLVSLGAEFATVGLSAGIIFAARWLDKMWLASIVLLALGAIALVLYRKVLAHCSEVAHRRRENLMQNLCR